MSSVGDIGGNTRMMCLTVSWVDVVQKNNSGIRSFFRVSLGYLKSKLF